MRSRPLPAASRLGLSLAAALEEYHKSLRAEPRARQGLHVSDVVKGVGVKCLRFVQLALNDADQNPTPLDYLTQKRLFHGTALHNIVYEHIGPAVDLLIRNHKVPLEVSIEIEKALVSEMGLHATPDVVMRFRDTELDILVETWVVDVKTREPSLFASGLRTDGQRNIEADIARQLQLYGDMVKADVMAVLWMESGPPYRFDQSTTVPGGRALKDVHSRISAANGLTQKGVFAPKHVTESCKWCRFKNACDQVGQT